jgi:hypothetical protein
MIDHDRLGCSSFGCRAAAMSMSTTVVAACVSVPSSITSMKARCTIWLMAIGRCAAKPACRAG